jgi:hypothetical protein
MNRQNHLRIVSPQPAEPVVSLRLVKTPVTPAILRLYERIFADVLPAILEDKQAG